ncbi:MAG: SDR family NAD(P)-dependent oxidoreductase [Pseudomonadota bacterium]
MAKTILVTGATDGIGLLTAQKLAADGHEVLVHGRSAEKLARAAELLGGHAKTYQADLSKMGDVTALAEEIKSDHDRLDVLINNAGILKSPVVETEAGRDIRFDVNTIAPYILTRALLPIMPSGARVVNLSSAAQARVDLDALQSFRDMGDMEAYAQSKLAITIWSAELAKQERDKIIVAVNPGSLLASKMVKEGFGVAGSDLNIGADILLRAALSPEFEGKSGAYFDNDSGSFAAPHAAAKDPGQIQGVMSVLAQLTGR